MSIAVIGWGSLIWDRRDLGVQGRWRTDGPRLPIEFARKSENGRLTLVTVPDAEPQQTYWVISTFTTVEAARENLREREGKRVALRDIHWATRSELHDAKNVIAALVQEWISLHVEVDAAIWTGLNATIEGPDVVAKAVQYLAGLADADTARRAREYVVRAPPQTQTRVRREMQARGWTDEPLSDDLVEPPMTKEQ